MSLRRVRRATPTIGLDEAAYDPATSLRQQRLERLKPRDGKHSPAMRLESLRASPYMFFHGESEEYTEAAREREEQRLTWLESKKGASPQRGDDGRNSNMSFGHTPLPPPPAPSPILLDSIYDDFNSDAFAGGIVLSTAVRLAEKRKKLHLVTQNNPIVKTDDYHANMGLFRRALLRCIAVDATGTADSVAAKPSAVGNWSFNNDNTASDLGVSVRAQHDEINLHVGMLRTELRDVFDVSSDKLLETFLREVSGRAATNRPGLPDTIAFQSVYNLFDHYVNSRDKRAYTARACFLVFDTLKCSMVSIGSIRELRGKAARYLPPGATFPMVKGMMDAFLRQPGVTTLSFDEFAAIFAESDVLVTAFIEEIIRSILVDKFDHDRAALMKL
jgi:hypothetical protein